ncbi:deoxyribodipyrimidine photo-lyase, partial [Streptomyces scabiei]
PFLYKEVPSFSDCTEVISEWAKTLEAKSVMANIQYEVNERELDAQVSEALASHDIDFELFHDKCVHPPTTVLNKQGEYFKVFTPFKR